MTNVQAPTVAALVAPKTSNRRFTLRLVVWNCVMAWIAIVFVSWLAPGVAGIVVPACVAVITWLCSVYVGVGYMDHRTAMGGAVAAATVAATVAGGTKADIPDCDPAPRGSEA